MSEIPVQSATRGAHEAPEEFDYAAFESTTRLDPVESADPEPTADLPLPGDLGSGDLDVSKMDELDSDPFADDLTKELASAAPKKWVNRTTIVFAALVLAMGGFVGGIQVQKHFGKQPSGGGAVNAQDFLAGLRNQARNGGLGGLGRGTGTGTGGFGGGAAGGGTAAASSQTGTIKLIDGDTIYVALPNGNVLTVKTDGTTKVQVASTGTLKSLKAGETVTIGGTPDATGTVTAKTVTATK
jgi:hypothetical protein